ncbi:sensor histidine kinase [Tahibacter sp. UC22_41]|uniref:sensor histidine kinase n=1 Tax=Tahibacter sp. UC22_41 TaxID=3350178 RepID=UPI0036D8DE3A
MSTEPHAWSLRRRIGVGLVGYVMLLSAAVLLHGYIVNERAEHLVWESLLHAEFDHLVERHRRDAGFGLLDSETLQLFTPATGMPAQLAGLAPGIHDEIVIDGRERVLLVRDIDGERAVLALDITDLEQREATLSFVVLVSTLLLVGVLSAVSVWGIDKLVRPLRQLAERIGSLDPGRSGELLQPPSGASVELGVIVDAMNDYLGRNARFLERERRFLDTASHELRTPIAIIAGAAQNALNDARLAAPARNQILRIHESARDVEKLIALLLVLAKDPSRLAEISEPVALHQLLPRIVDDHRHLCVDKALTVRVSIASACTVTAPPDIVRAAVGNLLRNAIENSDQGEIVIALDPPAVVRIEDPGHGMTPEQISAIHSRLARGGERDGGGIGLALIGRLCEHLGWRLDIASRPGHGSCVALDLARSLPPI